MHQKKSLICDGTKKYQLFSFGSAAELRLFAEVTEQSFRWNVKLYIKNFTKYIFIL